MIVHDIEVEERLDIPLREVSGLAVGHDAEGAFVLAVGDRGPDLSIARLADDGLPRDWTTLDVRELAGAPAGKPSQAEAVAVDAVGTVVVLAEDPARVAMIDLPGRRWLAVADLDASAVPGLGRRWADDPASRGEGVALLRGGRLLVIKEKRPAGLLEFAADGDAPLGLSAATILGADEPWAGTGTGDLHAVGWWPLDDALDDISDVAVGADGRVYLLSDQSRAVARLAGDLDPRHAGASVDTLWRLPKKVAKAEGLAFLPDGRALVAVDRPGEGRNLMVLPCLWPS